jgi:PPM family protein phosphatase
MLNFLKKIFSSKPKIEEQAIEEADENTELDIRAIVVSDLGMVRTNNEDCGYFVRPNDPKVRTERGFLGIVADGMGGHAAGEIASKLAVETIRTVYYQRDEGIEECLFFAFTNANRQIYNEAQKNITRKGMGTTCTAVVICEQTIYYAHVGDSRLYHLHNGKLKQLSEDHTYVQELVKKGVITPQQADSHPERNVLTRAMGTQNRVEIDVDVISNKFNEGDRLLLCSDGLYDYFNQNEIEQILLEKPLKEAAYQLTGLAKERGGHDNITVVIIEYQPIQNTTTKVTMDLEQIKNQVLKPTQDFVVENIKP